MANDTYFTVIIPGVPVQYRTQWHPSWEVAQSLSRGAFKTYAEAIDWARDHLGGTPYTVRPVPKSVPSQSLDSAPR